MDKKIEDLWNIPIPPSEAANMLRRRAPPNCKPWDAECIRANNARVDAWKTNVLDKVSGPDGNVSSGMVWGCFTRYQEGLAILEFMKMFDAGLIVSPPEDVVMGWKELFETKTITELHALGNGVVSYGWDLLSSYIKVWYAVQKFERLYSKMGADGQPDPVVWEREYYPCKDLLDGKEMPFWNSELYLEIHEKVATVLINKITPQQASGGFTTAGF